MNDDREQARARLRERIRGARTARTGGVAPDSRIERVRRAEEVALRLAGDDASTLQLVGDTLRKTTGPTVASRLGETEVAVKPNSELDWESDEEAPPPSTA